MEAKSPDAPILPPMPDFEEFYRAINGRDPFPWQARLSAQVAHCEEWPEEIGVPTGLGKTACLDIALWWLASQADRPPADRSAPTRIWWVVNRRLLVDAVTHHAETIGQALADPSSFGIGDERADVVAAISDRLRSLSAGTHAAPLEVIRLRGGISSRRPTDPSTPAVVLSTLPMYGSRLLFRGYGSTRSMRPIDAAMAGTDALVLLDEAHLAPHLRSLISALAECTPGAQAILGEARSRPRVVALTATGNAGETSRFDLDADDEAHPVVRQRLDAVKPVEVRSFDSGDIAPRLAEAALSLIGEAPAPAACLVFANTPGNARAAFQLLQKDRSAEVLLLTGRAREREAERVRTRILDPADGMASTRDPSISRQRPLIVVATQTLEVGADVDADYMVTEACGVRALTQRLGRLNRLGRHAHARGIYVHLPPTPSKRGKAAASEWPVYGEEPHAVLERLQGALGKSATDAVNLSPRRIAGVLGAPADDPGRAPEILPGILWEWVKTTTPPEGEAPVEPYFSGIAGPDYAVSLIWRAHVPEDGELLWPRASDREAVEVPIGEARDAFDEEQNLLRVALDGVTMERVTRDDLRPGDTLVLPCDLGLLDEFGWDPSSTSPVVDISILEHGLPLDAKALLRLTGLSLADPVDRALGISRDDEDLDEAEQDEALERILADLAAAPPQGWEEGEWQDCLAALDRQILTARHEVPRLPRRSSGGGDILSGELDEVSLTDTAVLLDRHSQAVAMRTRQTADRLGLTAALAAVLERAGLMHDIGKADRRFQRWLDPDEKHAGVKVAKSNMPRHLWNGARAAAGWPAGGRHEELSARLVRRWLELHPTSCNAPLHDLLLHLILSHHGSGRPLLPPVEDATTTVVSEVVEGASVEASADLSIVDWDQPARFRRLSDQCGPWGLALLEAILRQSDHAVSAGADVGHLEIR